MEEQTTAPQEVEGTTQSDENPSQEVETVSIDQYKKLEEQLEKLAASKERILKEAKEYKTQAQTMKSQAEQERLAKLEEEGKHLELIESLKNQLHERETREHKVKTDVLKKEIQFQVQKHASDADDINQVLKLLPTDVLEIDTDGMTVAGVDKAIEQMREAMPNLWSKARAPKMVSENPGAKPMAEAAPRRLEDLNSSQRSAALAELLKTLPYEKPRR